MSISPRRAQWPGMSPIRSRPSCTPISCMHCMTVSLAAGGMGLGTMWGEQKARQMLADAGFDKVETKHVEGDIFNNYYVATRA